MSLGGRGDKEIHRNVTVELKRRVWVGTVSPGYGEPDYPAGVFSTEAKASAWAQAEPGREYDEFEVDGGGRG